jgi:hypothetical protein
VILRDQNGKQDTGHVNHGKNMKSIDKLVKNQEDYNEINKKTPRKSRD